jgi:hypothetical protein
MSLFLIGLLLVVATRENFVAIKERMDRRFAAWKIRDSPG